MDGWMNGQLAIEGEIKLLVSSDSEGNGCDQGPAMCPESSSILGCMNRRIAGRWREVVVILTTHLLEHIY